MPNPYPFSFVYYTASVAGGDPDPNVTPPAANRITQVAGLSSTPDVAVLWVGDTGSVTVALWFKESVSGKWLPIGASHVVAAGAAVFTPVPVSVQIFAQVLSIAGGATKFGLGYTSGDLGAPMDATTLASILAKLSSDPATQTTLAALLAKTSGDQATQTTLAAVLAKLTADPATNTTLSSLLTAIGGGLPATLGPAVPGSSLSEVQAESTSLVTGQQDVTASALALNGGTTTSFKNGFRLKNLSTSTAPVFYGATGVTATGGDELAVGESIVLPVANIAIVFVIAAVVSTARVSWVGLP